MAGSEVREKVLEFVRINGPILPARVASYIEESILIASAVLSELSSRKDLIVSYLKIGGSPLYYVKGQEFKLQNFSDKLKKSEKMVYDLIKEKNVILNSELEPWQRVSIREIKDFARPIKVTHEGSEYIFWKWYLFNEEEFKKVVSSKIEKPKEVIPEKPVEVKEVQPVEGEVKEQERKTFEPKEPEVKPVQEESVKEIVKPVEVQEEIVEKPIEPKVEPEKEEPKIVEKKPIKKPTGEFYNNVCDFLGEMNCKIESDETITKNKDFNFIVVGDSFGSSSKMFVKAKSKKTINEGDIALAFLESSLRLMNCIYISDGKLTKKAEKVMERLNGRISFKKI